MAKTHAYYPRYKKINEDNIEEYKARALQGDVESQYDLGSYYYSHKRKNYPEAKKWLTMAAELGYAPALIMLADRYIWGYHGEKDTREGLRLYNLAIESGDTSAMIRLGNYYYFGRRLEEDKKEAFRLYSLAAEKGAGLSCLARCYYDGGGVEQDYNEAFRLFTKAGDKEMLGECYLHGHGVERNVEKTIELWEDEEFEGIYHMYERLAYLYSDGIYMEPNYENAVYYMWQFVQDDIFEDRLKALHPELNYRLATYYYEGKGVKKDRSYALKLFKLTIDGFHEFNERAGCPISEEPEPIINARKMLVKHGKKSMINTLQKAANNGDAKAKEILDEFGIEIVKPAPKKVAGPEPKPTVTFTYKKPEPKAPVEVSIGEKLFHKVFGEGIVYSAERDHISVEFGNGEVKTFLNPDAFEKGHLRKSLKD